nr:translation initiation factor IF-2-like [Pan troglodytes]
MGGAATGPGRQRGSQGVRKGPLRRFEELRDGSRDVFVKPEKVVEDPEPRGRLRGALCAPQGGGARGPEWGVWLLQCGRRRAPGGQRHPRPQPRPPGPENGGGAETPGPARRCRTGWCPSRGWERGCLTGLRSAPARTPETARPAPRSPRPRPRRARPAVSVPTGSTPERPLGAAAQVLTARRCSGVGLAPRRPPGALGSGAGDRSSSRRCQIGVGANFPAATQGEGGGGGRARGRPRGGGSGSRGSPPALRAASRRASVLPTLRRERRRAPRTPAIRRLGALNSTPRTRAPQTFVPRVLVPQTLILQIPEPADPGPAGGGRGGSQLREGTPWDVEGRGGRGGRGSAPLPLAPSASLGAPSPPSSRVPGFSPLLS